MMQKKVKSKSLQTIVKISLILFLAAIGLYYILKDDPVNTFKVLGQVNIGPLLVIILLVIAILSIDGLILMYLAKRYNKKYSFGQGVINAQIGNFIGSFNKASASFVQAYTFTKQDIKGANAASILTMNFLVYQIVFVVYSILMFSIGFPVMSGVNLTGIENIPLYVFALIGLIISAVILVVIVLLSFCKPIHRFFIDVVVLFSVKLHLVDSEEECRKKWTLRFVTYRLEMAKLRKNIKVFIFLILTHIAKQILLNTLPYVCLWALKVNVGTVSYWNMLVSSSYFQLISSYIPAGGAEIAYQETYFSEMFFKNVTEISNISASNILWRLMTFYFNLIVGGLCFIFYKGKSKKRLLRYNTATLFDLEVINFTESADYNTKDFAFGVNFSKGKRKHHSNQALLSEDDVKKSFDRIKECMDDIPIEEIIVENQVDLTEQKKQLALALKETEELLKQKQISKEVIDLTDEEIKLKRKKVREKILKRIRKQRGKEIEKLENLQVDGSKLSIDENKGIKIDGPEMNVTKTNVTYDSDEDEEEEEN